VRFLIGLLAAWVFQQTAIVQEMRHSSQVLGGSREYRAILPPQYAASQKRYPVLYWLHGYEQTNAEREREIADYVAAHDLIVIESGPVETAGSFPLYFPELVATVDKSLRTLADRDHRAITGVAMGGFMAWWAAGKFPDLVASASNFMGVPEAGIGPKDFDVEYTHDDFFANYDGIRTRLIAGAGDPLEFYHHRLDSIWSAVRPDYDFVRFEAAQATEIIPKTLDFHLQSFAHPLPRPAVFTHSDVYPNFTVWGWEINSDRKQPAITTLENVSSRGFRSSVREWIPGGAPIPAVKLSITSPARLYPPASTQAITYIRLRDGNVRRATRKADAQGRLSFDLDGDEYEVGVAAGGVIVPTGYEVADAAWATAGKPVKLRVKFWNKGGARSATSTIQWQSPDPGIKFDPPSSRLFGLGPGESADLPVSVITDGRLRAMVKIVAAEGTSQTPLYLPLWPQAETARVFQIADGTSPHVYRNATQEVATTLGEGNRDQHAAPGESFAILIPDGEALRAAELFTNDGCVDNTMRASDSWTDYDRSGASVHYSLPVIRKDCQPGHVVHMLARIVVPARPAPVVKLYAVEFPVWYRAGEEPK
jgi:hypothetical protein